MTDAREYIEAEAMKVIKRYKRHKNAYCIYWKSVYGSAERGRRIYIDEMTRRIIDKAIKVFGELMATADGYVTPYTHLLAEQTYDLLTAGIYIE